MARLITAEIPTLFGNQLLTKRRSFLVSANVSSALSAYLLDENGSALTLSNDEYKFKARFAEAVSKERPTATVEEIEIENDGRLLIDVPSDISITPAIYDLSVAAVNRDNDQIEYITDYFIYLEPTIWLDNESSRRKGPPPYTRLKLLLRDSSLFENELTQNYQFILTDICEAAIDAIELFNMLPPAIDTLAKTTATFPIPKLFMSGIETMLFRNILEHYRKNSLQYVSAGLQINDNKLNEYSAAYMEAFKNYQETVMRLKVQANYARGWGSIQGLFFPHRGI